MTRAFENVSATTRRIMLANRPRGNLTTELAMVRVLRSANLRGWRRHVKLAGTPDFLWRDSRVALFVDGCFWHGCPHCKKVPEGYRAYWVKKIQGNKARDRRVSRVLIAMGWKVLRVWECKVSSPRTLAKIRSAILGAAQKPLR